MLNQTKPYRYRLPKKAVKTNCPQCGNRHKKTFSRYVDTETGDLLPESYGRCDRESNCGYYLNPYHKQASGLSYADEVKQPTIPSEWFRLAGKQKRVGIAKDKIIQSLRTAEGATLEEAERVVKYVFVTATLPTLSTSVYSIPDDVFSQSLGHYEQNQFTRLLGQQFGQIVAKGLLQRFQIGTSSRWPGACVFWFIDEKGRKRGGQIKLFGPDWHTVKYVDAKGEKRSKTSWVHSALTYRLEQAGKPVPDWLKEYNEQADRSPCLFALPQLLTAPTDKPVALVEAPKTAVVCAAMMPDFIWMAVGSLSYLNAERLAPLRGRKIMLFPDLNAYYDRVNEKGQTIKGWATRADELRGQGFQVEISDYLERVATPDQKQAGLDVADFLLTMPPTCSGSWPPPGSVPEFMTVEPCDTYPADWDVPSEPGRVPVLQVKSFHEFQQQHPA